MRERNNVIELNRIITGAVFGNAPAAGTVNIMNYEEIKAQARIAAESPEYTNALFGYIIPEKFTGSVKELFWALTSLESALPQAKNLPAAEKSAVYNNYITLLTIYVTNVYNKKMLTPDGSRLLPPEHRFGFFMHEARQCLEKNDNVGYVRNLKTALEADKSKADIIGTLIGSL